MGLLTGGKTLYDSLRLVKRGVPTYEKKGPCPNAETGEIEGKDFI